MVVYKNKTKDLYIQIFLLFFITQSKQRRTPHEFNRCQRSFCLKILNL